MQQSCIVVCHPAAYKHVGEHEGSTFQLCAEKLMLLARHIMKSSPPAMCTVPTTHVVTSSIEVLSARQTTRLKCKTEEDFFATATVNSLLLKWRKAYLLRLDELLGMCISHTQKKTSVAMTIHCK